MLLSCDIRRRWCYATMPRRDADTLQERYRHLLSRLGTIYADYFHCSLFHIIFFQLMRCAAINSPVSNLLFDGFRRCHTLRWRWMPIISRHTLSPWANAILTVRRMPLSWNMPALLMMLIVFTLAAAIDGVVAMITTTLFFFSYRVLLPSLSMTTSPPRSRHHVSFSLFTPSFRHFRRFFRFTLAAFFDAFISPGWYFRLSMSARHAATAPFSSRRHYLTTMLISPFAAMNTLFTPSRPLFRFAATFYLARRCHYHSFGQRVVYYTWMSLPRDMIGASRHHIRWLYMILHYLMLLLMILNIIITRLLMLMLLPLLPLFTSATITALRCWCWWYDYTLLSYADTPPLTGSATDAAFERRHAAAALYTLKMLPLPRHAYLDTKIIRLMTLQLRLPAILPRAIIDDVTSCDYANHYCRWCHADERRYASDEGHYWAGILLPLGRWAESLTATTRALRREVMADAKWRYARCFTDSRMLDEMPMSGFRCRWCHSRCRRRYVDYASAWRRDILRVSYAEPRGHDITCEPVSLAFNSTRRQRPTALVAWAADRRAMMLDRPPRAALFTRRVDEEPDYWWWYDAGVILLVLIYVERMRRCLMRHADATRRCTMSATAPATSAIRHTMKLWRICRDDDDGLLWRCYARYVA